LFNLNTKIPIYFKNQKVIVCVGQTNDTSDTGLRNFMSLLVALKVAKNKGAEICGLNLGKKENQTYIGNWYCNEDTSAYPMFKANLNLFKALFPKENFQVVTTFL
jgi:hypothetical protein